MQLRIAPNFQCITTNHMEQPLQRTYLLGTVKGILSSQRNGNEILVSIDEGVSDRDNSRVVKGQGDSSNGLDTRQEAIEKFALINIENFRREYVSLIEDLDDSHTVGERGDIQHVQEGSLRSSNTGTGSDDLDIGHNFNSTTSNLGGDTESLEERGFSGFHTSVDGRDNDVFGSIGTSTSGGGNLVGNNDFANVFQVVIGKYETDVAFDVREETFKLG